MEAGCASLRVLLRARCEFSVAVDVGGGGKTGAVCLGTPAESGVRGCSCSRGKNRLRRLCPSIAVVSDGCECAGRFEGAMSPSRYDDEGDINEPWSVSISSSL